MPKPEQQIYLEVVLRARTGASLLRDSKHLSKHNIHLFEAHPDTPAEVIAVLERAGFKVIAASHFGVSIVGPEALIRDYFKTRVVEAPIESVFGLGRTQKSTGFVLADVPLIPDAMVPHIESVYVPRKGRFFAGEGAMPSPPYYCLKPPTDITKLTNADYAHTRGLLGTNIKVAIVDTGFIANHDYYAGKGYNTTVHAVIGDASEDEYGHGTGIASNLLAIAPKCQFHMFKMYDGANWAALAAFRAARLAGMQVISCSWGQGYDSVLEAEIIEAVHTNGITVAFAAGNGPGGASWPGSMPDVISVGGAYPLPGGGWTASNYASSGYNAEYPARHCPDVCGTVGLMPMGILIVMPTMQGSTLDAEFSDNTFPSGDQTGPSDGWLVASGTSSATPQVAGAAAVLLQAKSSLAPTDIKQVLEDTAIDITTGASADGDPAGPGPDYATGAGMIDIGAAVDHVKPVLKCPPAPLKCPPAPLKCPPAPLKCPPAPLVKCPPAPLKCPPAPLKCPPAPLKCPPAPLIICPPSPTVTCPAGPAIAGPGPVEGDPGPVLKGQRLVPYVVYVDEAQAQQWMAQEQESGGQGAEGEYVSFPDVQGCVAGPFEPKVRS